MDKAVRDTFVVDCPLRRDQNDNVLSWLHSSGSETTIQSERVVFRFHLWPNGREELATQTRLDAINGGIGNTVDLERGIRQTYQAITTALERRVWPAGRPEVEGETEKRLQLELLAQAFHAISWLPVQDDDEEGKVLLRRRDAYDRMSLLRDQQEMAASWTPLIVSPPPGWEDIAERELRTTYRDALTNAFIAARDAAVAASGK